MKILLIRFSSLGDAVLATAAVEALREDLPEAEVHVLTKPAFQDIFRNNPGIKKLLHWNPAKGLLALASQIRAEKYDYIVDLHGNLRTRVLRRLAPDAKWTRYRKGSMRRRAAVLLKRPNFLGTRHVVDNYIEALKPLGVDPRRRLPRLYPDAANEIKIEKELQLAGWTEKMPVLALAPGARWKTKAWPKDKWIELLAALNEDDRVFSVLIGGSEDRAMCAEILKASNARGANMAGKFSIPETAALLRKSRLLVSNDSAPMHIAGSVGTPVVALFGPTVKGFGFYPLGERDVVLEKELSCRPCSLHGDENCPKGHHRCLDNITVSEVLETITELSC